MPQLDCAVLVVGDGVPLARFADRLVHQVAEALARLVPVGVFHGSQRRSVV